MCQFLCKKRTVFYFKRESKFWKQQYLISDSCAFNTLSQIPPKHIKPNHVHYTNNNKNKFVCVREYTNKSKPKHTNINTDVVGALTLM